MTIDNAARLATLARIPCAFISRLVWSADGATLLAANGEGVWLWEGTFAPEPTRKLEGHEGPVKDVAFSPDGAVIATASADATVRLWDRASGQPLHVLRKHSDAVNAVAFDARGRLLASAGGDQRVIVLGVDAAAEISVLTGHIREITSLAFVGNTLASGGWDKMLWLWDLPTRRVRATIPVGDWIRDLAASPDGRTLAVACKDGTFRLVDVESAEITCVMQAHERGVDSVAFSPDGSLLVTGGRDQLVRVWDLRSHASEPLITLAGHEKPVLAAAFHPNGSLLVTGSGDHTLRLWGVGN